MFIRQMERDSQNGNIPSCQLASRSNSGGLVLLYFVGVNGASEFNKIHTRKGILKFTGSRLYGLTYGTYSPMRNNWLAFQFGMKVNLSCEIFQNDFSRRHLHSLAELMQVPECGSELLRNVPHLQDLSEPAQPCLPSAPRWSEGNVWLTASHVAQNSKATTERC